MLFFFPYYHPRQTANRLSFLVAVVLTASTLAKLRPISLAAAERKERAAAAAARAATFSTLADRLSRAADEAGLLRAGADAAAALFPGARVIALGAFAAGGGGSGGGGGDGGGDGGGGEYGSFAAR